MNIRFFVPLILLLILPGCSPIGIAASTGATLGIAASEDGGIQGAAEDLQIRVRISDLWFRYNVETFAKLNLTVNQGRVLITGVVQNPDARVEAVRLAWQVKGVKQVINEIRVADSEGFPGFLKDEWITTRLRAALTFDRDVRSINYSIDTVQGTIYLMGVARNQEEVDRVIEIARTIPGAQQVVSYVKKSGEEPPVPGQAPAVPATMPNAGPAAANAPIMTQQIQQQPPQQPAQQTLPPPGSGGGVGTPAPVQQQMLPP